MFSTTIVKMNCSPIPAWVGATDFDKISEAIPVSVAVGVGVSVGVGEGPVLSVAVGVNVGVRDGRRVRSGSTGKAKGVMVEHKNAVRLVINSNYTKFGPETRLLQTGAPVFDATTFEIWGTLLNGGTLVLTDKNNILDAKLIEKELVDNEINTLFLSSTLFNQLLQQNDELFSTERG